MGAWPLGDYIEKALASVGLTKDVVTRFVGPECGCRERREKMNALGAWAHRVMSGRSQGEQAVKEVGGITGEELTAAARGEGLNNEVEH